MKLLVHQGLFSNRASLVAETVESACDAGDRGSIPGSEDLPERTYSPVFLPGELQVFLF